MLASRLLELRFEAQVAQPRVRELRDASTVELLQMLGSRGKTREGSIRQSSTLREADLAQLAEPAFIKR